MRNRHVFTDAVPGFDPAGKYRVQAMWTGEWQHDQHGKIEVTKADLETVLRNFKAGKRRLVLDYDHGTDYGATPEDRKAAGWFDDLELEEREDGSAVLWATVGVTDAANEYIEDGEYMLFSPTWHPNYKNKETGELQGPTLLRGALTNNPFLDGGQPMTRVMSEGARKWAERAGLVSATDAATIVTLRLPAGMDLAEVVASLEEKGYVVDGVYRQQAYSEGGAVVVSRVRVNRKGASVDEKDQKELVALRETRAASEKELVALREEVVKLKGGASEQVLAMTEKLAAVEGQVKTLAEERDKAAGEARAMRRSAALDRNRDRISHADREKFGKLFDSDEKMFTEIVASLPVRFPGTQAAIASGEVGSASDEFLAKVKDVEEKDKKKFSDAVRIVSMREPDLHARYVQERRSAVPSGGGR